MEFSAYPHSNFHLNASCFEIQILRDLDKGKIVNISNVKFSIITYKVNFTKKKQKKIIVEKACEATKEKKDMGLKNIYRKKN